MYGHPLIGFWQEKTTIGTQRKYKGEERRCRLDIRWMTGFAPCQIPAVSFDHPPALQHLSLLHFSTTDMSVTSTMEALARLLRPAPPPPAPGSASPAGDKMDVHGDAESPVDFLRLIKEDEKEDPVTPEELEALEKRIAEMAAPEPEKLAERVSSYSLPLSCLYANRVQRHFV